MTRSRFSTETSADPPHWQEILAPPPNETPEEREARKQREARDASHSRKIDEEIKAEAAAEQRRTKDAIKVLLLGQAHAGASRERCTYTSRSHTLPGKSTVIKSRRVTYPRTPSPLNFAPQICNWPTRRMNGKKSARLGRSSYN